MYVEVVSHMLNNKRIIELQLAFVCVCLRMGYKIIIILYIFNYTPLPAKE